MFAIASNHPSQAVRSGCGRGCSEGSVAKAHDSDYDVSSTRLEETVRIPPERWPDMLVVTAKGLRKEALAAELLDKVWPYARPDCPSD